MNKRLFLSGLVVAGFFGVLALFCALDVPREASVATSPAVTAAPPAPPLVETLSALRYSFRPDGAECVRAENPAHGYGVAFTPNGLEVTPRKGSLRLKAASWGYADAQQDLAPVSPRAYGNRVDYEHAGLTEWYINTDKGLEQGFTVAAPPAKNSENLSELEVQLSVNQGWIPTVHTDAAGVTLFNSELQSTINYDHLKVLDARGVELSAWLSTVEVAEAEHRLVISVADGEAQYPIVIDPILTAPSTGDGASGDQFGFSVSLSGDTVVVGAPGDDIGEYLDHGSIYIYTRAGATWTLQQKVRGGSAINGLRYGNSLSLEGDTLAVGAPGAYNGSGSVHVLKRTGSIWEEVATVLAEGTSPGDAYGSAVSLSGSTLAIGAPFHVTGAAVVGAVYTHNDTGTTWDLEAKLLASNRSDYWSFGASVALDGNTVIVGAPKSAQAAGTAYAFVRSGNTWSQQAILTPSASSVDDGYGASVAISGNTAVVGASRSDTGANNAGSAFVFTRAGTVWSQQQQLTATDAAASDSFGASVSIDTDLVIAGAPNADVNGNANQGAAYVFLRTGGVWAQEEKIAADVGSANDQFGSAVAIDGSTAACGAPSRTLFGNTGQGAAFVHFRTGTDWSQQAAFDTGKGLSNSQFGTAVAIDNTTLAVGAPNENDLGGEEQGAVYIYTQSGGNWTLQARVVAGNAAAGDHFGASVSLQSDTVVIGAPNKTVSGHANQGAAYVFVRAGQVWTQQAQLTATESAAGDLFGTSVAFNGNTAVVGAPVHAVNGKAGQGAAYVFTRLGVTWTEQRELVSTDGAVGDNFGTSVAVFADIAVIGAPLADLPAIADCGAGYAFTRTGSVWSQQARMNATISITGDQLGFSAAVAGTLALLGAPNRDQQSSINAGSVFSFEQNGNAWPVEGELIPFDGHQNDKFGWSVSMNGDYALVGVPFATQNGFDPTAGSAYFFNHGSGEWVAEAKKISSQPQLGSRFGFSVAVSGAGGVIGIPYADVGDNARQGTAQTVDLPALNQKPILNPIGDRQVDEGGTLTFTVTGSDPDGDTFEFYLDAGAPPGVELDAITGVFTYSPTDGLASFPLTFRIRETNRFPNLSSTESMTLVVLNVPPTIEIDGQLSAAATVPYVLTVGEIVDPGEDTATAVSIDWGDGATEPANTPGDYTHSYADGSVAGIPRTIRLSVTDEDGTVPAAATLRIKVYAGPPTIQMQGVSTSAEGSDYTLTLSNPVDPDGVITGGLIDWGDNQTTPYTGPKAYTHLYVDGSKNGTVRTISVDLTDARGTFEDVASKKITITNVAPTVQISGNPTANENQPYTLIVSAPSDPGNDTVSGGMIHWGDNTHSAYTSPGPYSHTYSSAFAGSDITITIDLSDEDGTYLALASKTVGVLKVNRPPAAQDGTLAVIGTTTTQGALKGTDPDSDPITFIITQQPLKGVVTITDAATGAYTYKATNNVSGLDQFLFKVNDGKVDSNQAAVLVTLTKANSSPVFLSPARATPATVDLGKPVTFSVVVNDVDGDPLTYTWDFGDGSQLGTGAVATHTYAAVGVYTAQVSVSDGKNPEITSTVQVTVNQPVVTVPLVISKMQIKLNFAKAGNDSITFSGTLPIVDGFGFAGKTCVIDVGAVHKSLTLDAKGKSTPKGVDSMTISKPKNGVAKYSVKFSKGNFATALAESGLTNETLTKVTRTVVTSMTFDGKTYQKSQTVIYSAKAGKSGTAASPKGS